MATACCLPLCSAYAETPLDDPMRPASPPGTTTPTEESLFVLGSTLITHERRSAIINGKYVVPGDTVTGAQVMEILPTQVSLRQADRTIIVQLLPITVKSVRHE